MGFETRMLRLTSFLDQQSACDDEFSTETTYTVPPIFTNVICPRYSRVKRFALGYLKSWLVGVNLGAFATT
jgi:hypothetical protein